MKKNKLTNYFLAVGVLTFITVFVFVVQQSYSNLMKPIDDVQNNSLLKPIDPNLDTSILDQIEKRHSYFSPIEEASSSSNSAIAISTPTPNE